MTNRTGLIATKIGNSSYFSENGKVIPVTLLRVEECIVSNIKTMEKDGYNAVQIASIETKKDINNRKYNFLDIIFQIFRYLRDVSFVSGRRYLSKRKSANRES